MPSEAEEVLDVLRDAGYTVEYKPEFRSEMLREWRKSPPDAFVIDLSRLPSHGKEIAIALRRSPTTRRIPIIFCQGELRKVAALRELLPDASYCQIPELVQTVTSALTRPVAECVIPAAMMDRYQGRSTAEKLGLRQGSTLALIDPPPHVAKILGELPAQVEWLEGDADVTLCFLHNPDSLRRTFSEMKGLSGRTKLWMLWCKKTSPGHSGVTEPAVRDAGVSLGLVDYKICSVNQDWSGMLFAAAGNRSKRGRPAL